MCEYCRTKIGKCGDIESDNAESLLEKGTDFSVDVSIIGDGLFIDIDSVDDDGNVGRWKSWDIDINYCPICGRVLNNDRAFRRKVMEAKQTAIDVIEEHNEAAVTADLLNDILDGAYSYNVRVRALKELIDEKRFEKDERDNRLYYLDIKQFK